jgi:hypothetical protein
MAAPQNPTVAWSAVMFVLPKFQVLESCLFQQLEWQLKGSVQVIFYAITKQVEGAIIKQVGQKGKAIPNYLIFCNSSCSLIAT